MLSGRVLVVGGSPEAPAPDLLRSLAGDCDLVVACDAGADALASAGVRCDVLIGDGDSMSARSLAFARKCGAEVVPFAMDKDETDLGLALKWARQAFVGDVGVVLSGVTGGRPDHQLGVLGILARARDLSPVVVENGCTMWVLGLEGRPSVVFDESEVGKTLSVFSLLGDSCISERGLKWELDRAVLAPLSDLGVSNVIASAGASVEVHEGVALVVLIDQPQLKRCAFDEEC